MLKNKTDILTSVSSGKREPVFKDTSSPSKNKDGEKMAEKLKLDSKLF